MRNGSDPAAGTGGGGTRRKGSLGEAGVALEEAAEGGRAPGGCSSAGSSCQTSPGPGLHAVGMCAALTAAQTSFTAVLTPWQPRQGNM